MAKIALMGLGIMGSGMAHNLLHAGHAVTVYNRTPTRADALKAEGATVAANPADAAHGAEFVISMVGDDAASRSVWLAENGALAQVAPGTILIESSTLSPGWVRELAGLAQARGAELIDATVTGSKLQAAAGELGFFVGGEKGTLERAEPILLAMGKTIQYLGPAGSGAMMKLINNLMAGIEQVMLAEAMALAEQSGLNFAQVAQIVSEGPVSSGLIKRKMPLILKRDYDPAFTLDWMHKDMTYALAEGARANVPLPLVSAAREVMRMAMARGWGNKDSMVVYELLRPQH